jgi:hypothetical protein
MKNSERSGLGTRMLAWAVIAIVALFAIKVAFGIVLGLVQFAVTIALIALVAMGVLWALRHL